MKPEAYLEFTQGIFSQVTGIWDTIINSDRVQDKNDDIVLNFENWTKYPFFVELNQTPNKDFDWREAKNNCTFIQPFIPPAIMDTRSGITTPGTGTVIWDNDKFDVGFHSLNAEKQQLFLRKTPGNPMIGVEFRKEGESQNENFCSRQSFTLSRWLDPAAVSQGNSLAIGVAYSCDTRTFSIMVAPHTW